MTTPQYARVAIWGRGAGGRERHAGAPGRVRRAPSPTLRFMAPARDMRGPRGPALAATTGDLVSVKKESALAAGGRDIARAVPLHVETTGEGRRMQGGGRAGGRAGLSWGVGTRHD
jgi:hypothetical protein